MMLDNLNVYRSIQRLSSVLEHFKIKFQNTVAPLPFSSARFSSFWVVLSTMLVGFALYVGVPKGVMVFITAIPFVAIVSLGLRDILRLKDRLREEIEALKLFSVEAHRLVVSGESSYSERDILDLVPLKNLLPTVHAKELIESVAKVNLNVLSAPVESMLHTPRRELEGRLGSAMQYGGISTRLGILGTFVGLVVAIDGLGQSFEYLTSSGSATGDRESMSTTLESLSFAFVTSIWGLVGSFVISLTGRDFRVRLEEFYHAFVDAFSYGRELAYKAALSDASVHKSLVDVGRDLRAVERRLADHGESVRLGLEQQGHIVLRQADFLKQTALGLENGRESWQKAVSEMESAANALDKRALNSLRSLEERIAETKMALENGLEEIVQVISAETSNLRRSTASLEALVVSTEKNDHEAAITRSFCELKDCIEAIWHKIEMRPKPSIVTIGEKIEELTNAVSQSVGAQNNILLEMRRQTSAVKSNQETFIASISTGLRDAVSEIPTPIVKAEKSFSVSSFVVNLLIIVGLSIVIEVEILDDPLGLQAILKQQVFTLKEYL